MVQEHDETTRTAMDAEETAVSQRAEAEEMVMEARIEGSRERRHRAYRQRIALRSYDWIARITPKTLDLPLEGKQGQPLAIDKKGGI